MARFPRTEAEVIALAQSMVSGLTGNATVYPALPVGSLGLLKKTIIFLKFTFGERNYV